MASTNKTPNLGLNQWIGTDPVLREDFNSDNAILDAKLGFAPKMAWGSYVGNGEYGEDKPMSLTFDFEPKLVIVMAEAEVSLDAGSGYAYSNFFIVLNGTPKIRVRSYTGNRLVYFTWDGNTVSWWSDMNDSSQTYSGYTYNYLALA